MDDLSKAELQLYEREVALNEVKSQYDAAVQEKQRLTDAANVCLRKMTSATALINGLGGEKIRWTQQSKEFKKQLGRYTAVVRIVVAVTPITRVLFRRLVGDVLLATGFLSYCGPYNQEFRSNLVQSWMNILTTQNVPFTTKLNIINMLVENSMVRASVDVCERSNNDTASRSVSVLGIRVDLARPSQRRAVGAERADRDQIQFVSSTH